MRTGRGKRCAGLVVLLGLLGLTACREYSGVPAKNAGEPVTFRFFNVDGGTTMWDDPVAEAITEKTGVALQMEYPLAEGNHQIDLMIATSNYPDIIYAKGDADKLIDEGVLIDLRELIDRYGPNIKKLYGSQYEWLRYSEEEPAIYQLCSSALTDGNVLESGSVQLQFAVLKENGYGIPEDLAEFEAMLKSYMENHPQIDGKPVIGLSMVCFDWRWMITMGNPSGFIADGSPDDGQWLVDENLNMTYKHRSEKQKEFYRWLNRMYHEGVLDPDFAIQSYDDYLKKIAEGRVLALMDQEWEYKDSIIKLNSQGKAEHTYAQLPLTMEKTIPYRANLQSGRCVGWGIGITRACKDPVRAIQFIDYLCSEEGQILMNWGILGVNYFLDEEGRRYRTKEEIAWAREDVNYGAKTGVGYHAFPFPTYPAEARDESGDYLFPENAQTRQLHYNEEECQAARAWGVEDLAEIVTGGSTARMPDYPAIWSLLLPADLSRRIDQLNIISWKELVKCVICQEDEFDSCWDEFQQKLINAGVEDAEKEISQILKEKDAFYRACTETEDK